MSPLHFIPHRTAPPLPRCAPLLTPRQALPLRHRPRKCPPPSEQLSDDGAGLRCEGEASWLVPAHGGRAAGAHSTVSGAGCRLGGVPAASQGPAILVLQGRKCGPFLRGICCPGAEVGVPLRLKLCAVRGVVTLDHSSRSIIHHGLPECIHPPLHRHGPHCRLDSQYMCLNVLDLGCMCLTLASAFYTKYHVRYFLILLVLLILLVPLGKYRGKYL